MGYVPGSVLEPAVRHLLDILRQSGRVDYSCFYDGTDACHAALLRALELEDDWYSPELLMDLAAGLAEQAGLVRTEPLEARLADDEPDYAIVLTDPGRDFIASGQAFHCPDLDL